MQKKRRSKPLPDGASASSDNEATAAAADTISAVHEIRRYGDISELLGETLRRSRTCQRNADGLAAKFFETRIRSG